jgi:hypothetical protein
MTVYLTTIRGQSPFPQETSDIMAKNDIPVSMPQLLLLLTVLIRSNVFSYLTPFCELIIYSLALDNLWLPGY